MPRPCAARRALLLPLLLAYRYCFASALPRFDSRNVSQVTVDLPDGPLLVERVTMGTGTWLRARGVQYAEHPVGLLRFQVRT